MAAMSLLWRAPDGRVWYLEGQHYLEGARLIPAVQDPHTRQWRPAADRQPELRVDNQTFADWQEVEQEPYQDARITRLTELVEDVLTAYQDATGHPPDQIEDLRAALAQVQAIPDEMHKRSSATARQAASTASHRTRRHR
jgi:hypothetical protein